MVACISPADNNYDETLSTLRYANRAKNIKNKPRINQDPKDALLSQYQDEIKRLKEQLEKQPQIEGIVPLDNLEEERQKIRQEYESQLAALRQSYEMEKEGHAKLQADVQTLRSQYEKDLDGVQKDSSGHSTSNNNNNNTLSVNNNANGQKNGLSRRNSTASPIIHDAALTPEQQEALARFGSFCTI
jgi:hypothetical protein